MFQIKPALKPLIRGKSLEVSPKTYYVTVDLTQRNTASQNLTVNNFRDCQRVSKPISLKGTSINKTQIKSGHVTLLSLLKKLRRYHGIVDYSRVGLGGEANFFKYNFYYQSFLSIHLVSDFRRVT